MKWSLTPFSAGYGFALRPPLRWDAGVCRERNRGACACCPSPLSCLHSLARHQHQNWPSFLAFLLQRREGVKNIKSRRAAIFFFFFLSNSWQWGLLSLRKKTQINRVEQSFLPVWENDQIKPLDPKRPGFKPSPLTPWSCNSEQILSPLSFLLAPLTWVWLVPQPALFIFQTNYRPPTSFIIYSAIVFTVYHPSP